MGLLVAFFPLNPSLCPGAEKSDVTGKAHLQFEVERRQIIPLPAEGRNLIMQRVKPPVLPPLAAASSPSPSELARRAARRQVLPKRRFLPLTVWSYQGGWNFLQWSVEDAQGSVESLEAWSRTDFRSLSWMENVVVDGVAYQVIPLRMGPSRAATFRRSPGPLLPRPSDPDFELVTGNPDHQTGRRVMSELHRFYQREAPRLETQRQKVRRDFEAEQARLKANPPAPADSVVSFWPIRSNRFPATTPAVPKEGGAASVQMR